MASRERIDLDFLWFVLLIAVTFGGIWLLGRGDPDRAKAKCRAELFHATTADSIRVIKANPECAP